MIKIGTFSKITQISIRMLRHYEDIGLLQPVEVDDATGYRYYSVDQIQIANRIVALRDMDFGLAAIAEILLHYQDPEALRSLLSVRLEEVKEQEQDIQNRLLLIETSIKRLGEEDDSMNYDVALKTLPQRYVASLRKTIPSYDHDAELWIQMEKELGGQIPAAHPPSYPLAIYHDEGWKESDIDVEIQISVQGKHENTKRVTFKIVEPIEVASAIYKGSYDQSYQANGAVARWASENGYDYAGPMINIFHVNPGDDPNPDNWVTEVCCPIKKR